MGIRVTGVDLPFIGGGASWEYTESDKKIARAVVTFLEDRRVLFGDRHCEDERYCIHSAIAIRAFLKTRSPRPILAKTWKRASAPCALRVESLSPQVALTETTSLRMVATTGRPISSGLLSAISGPASAINSPRSLSDMS